MRQTPLRSRSRAAFLLLGWCFLGAGPGAAQPSPPPDAAPRVFAIDPEVVARSRAGYRAGHASLQPAFDRLFSEADQALAVTPPSVMDKRQPGASGDPHDYKSQAPYYWSDPDAPGGYVRRDGEKNPAAEADGDERGLKSACGHAETLALAFYFSGEEKYAAKAAGFLRVWFLDPATRMNPNLEFGQGIPGKVTGRPQGLISADCLVDAADAIGLLAGSKSWDAADQRGMVDWMTRYFRWLTTSKIGLGEAGQKNNHGTLYDKQAAGIAAFIGDTEAARKILATVGERRIARQILPDGTQPLELSRTRSFHYSLKNLEGLLDLAVLGQNLGVDLWHFSTPQNASIARALEYLVPYADPARPWPNPQITADANREELGELLLRAAPVFSAKAFAGILSHYPPGAFATSRSRLLFKTQIE